MLTLSAGHAEAAASCHDLPHTEANNYCMRLRAGIGPGPVAASGDCVFHSMGTCLTRCWTGPANRDRGGGATAHCRESGLCCWQTCKQQAMPIF